MNIPTPPTDNLYKFVALSGVVVALIGVALLWTQHQASGEAIGNFEDLVTLGQYEVERYQQEVDFLIATNGSSDAVREARRQMKQRFAEIAVAENAAERVSNAFTVGIIVASACMAIGIYFGYWGFRCWYERVQKYQDAVLKAEAQAHEVGEGE